jgi:hypothetical protein
MIAAQAIVHAAGQDDDGPVGTGVYSQLPLSSPSNLALWAPWVRGSLYVSDFLRHLDWTPGRRKDGGGTVAFDGVELTFRRKPFMTLYRPEPELFRKQLRHLRSYADQRADRSPEILNQVGYPTDYFAAILGLQNDVHAKCFELIAATQAIASHVALVAKHHLACLRPDRRGATVMPMIQTPAHGSFPSGHATEAFAVATVLSGLVQVLGARPPASRPYPRVDPMVALLYKQAERIAVNRTVAGLHFPIDTWAGAALGEAVGELILAKCRGGKASWRSYRAEDSDFLVAEFHNPTPMPDGHSLTRGLERTPAAITVPTSQLFAWLWGKTLDEFKP